jgi:zinc transporter
MADADGLICAYLLDGRGGGRELAWSELEDWIPARGPLWVHLNRSGTRSREWLVEGSGLDALISETLLAEETRPRFSATPEGLLLVLRGVNLNAGAEPEDMVAIRLWMDERRVLTVRKRHLMAVEDIRQSLAQGRGPCTADDLVVGLADRLVDRMGPVLSELEDEVDDLENEILEASADELRTRLSTLRRKVIVLRRHLAPQREVLARLQTERAVAIGDANRMRLREVADKVTRYVEDLDACRERAAVTHEQLTQQLSEQMNRTMYILSLVAAVFLPLGLLTGLLGINVGGIPGSDTPWAFGAVTLLLVLIAAVQIWFFRRRRFL